MDAEMMNPLEVICYRCSSRRFALVARGYESDETRCLDCGLELFWESRRPPALAPEKFLSLRRTVNGFVASGAPVNLDRLRVLNAFVLAAAGAPGDTGGIFRNELATGASPLGRDLGRLGPEGQPWIFASPELVPLYLGDFWTWFEHNESRLEPLEFGARAYQQLLRIRPFADGNALTVRLFLDLILQCGGYPPTLDLWCDPVRASTASVIESVMESVLAAAERLDGARSEGGEP